MDRSGYRQGRPVWNPCLSSSVRNGSTVSLLELVNVSVVVSRPSVYAGPYEHAPAAQRELASERTRDCKSRAP